MSWRGYFFNLYVSSKASCSTLVHIVQTGSAPVQPLTGRGSVCLPGSKDEGIVEVFQKVQRSVPGFLGSLEGPILQSQISFLEVVS